MDFAPPEVEIPPLAFGADILSDFPSKWSPRSEQIDAILKIQKLFDSGKRIVAFQGPTGLGKTLVGMTFANRVKAQAGNTHILTITKILQEQYATDFPSPEVEILKGRANYSCTHSATFGVDATRGYCKKEFDRSIIGECLEFGSPKQALRLALPPSAHRCTYWKQLQICHDSPITLFNFKSFLFQQRLGRFGRRRFMIIDECHNIEAELMNFVTLELSERVLSLIKETIDRPLNSKREIQQWLEEKRIYEKLVVAAGTELLSEDPINGLDEEDSDEVKKAILKVENFMRYLNATDWVSEVKPYRDRDGANRKKIVAKPLFVRTFAEDILFSKADKIIAMSATILDFKTWARNLGLSPESTGYVEGPCVFPTARRLIFLDYAANLGFKHFHHKQNPTWPKCVDKVVEIIQRHKGQKGIIHTHTNPIARLLQKEIGSPRFLFQTDFDENKKALLAEHTRRQDSIIVAPAMHEGIDLKDDLSRFQIIIKTPWPDLGDKLVSARNAVDKSYMPWQCALKLVQSYGRSIRSKDDWAVTYIIDEGFEDLLHRARKILPRWFLEALRQPEKPL